VYIAQDMASSPVPLHLELTPRQPILARPFATRTSTSNQTFPDAWLRNGTPAVVQSPPLATAQPSARRHCCEVGTAREGGPHLKATVLASLSTCRRGADTHSDAAAATRREFQS
jgi:hypothetical protein